MNISLIKTPNLPENKIKHCLIGLKYTEEAHELQALGAIPVKIKSGRLLEDEISCHADVNSFNMGSGNILVNKEITGELSCALPFIKTIPIRDDIASPYPCDVKLNALFLNDKIICNTKYIAKEILNFAEKNSLKIIHTNQGYAKCSACVVNENAIITEDNGLTTLLKKYQIDVLKVSQGEVFLSGNHSGFLGGASGKISRDMIYFSGNLERHHEYSKIIGFLDNYNVKPVFNTNRPLTDFGGFIQLTELV